MTILDLFTFENPEVVYVALGVLLFVVSFEILEKVFDNRGVSFLISLVLGTFFFYGLYSGRLQLEQNILALLLFVLALVIVLKIFWSFVKHSKRSFRKR